MPKPETMNQFYLHILEDRGKVHSKLHTITQGRALHWGVVGALLSIERPDRFSTTLLKAVIDRYQGVEIEAIATNGVGRIIITDYSLLSGSLLTPYIGFEGSSLYFGLTSDGQPDFDIASTKS